MPPNQPQGSPVTVERMLQAIMTGQIKVPLNPFLGLLPKQLWNRPKDLFIYGAEFLPIAASGAPKVDINIEADSDFLIMAANAVVTDTADAIVASTANGFDKFNPPFLVTLTTTGSGRSMMNTGISLANLFGTGQFPAVWTFPKLLRASTTFSVTLQNLVATAFNVRLSFHGIKVFSNKGG
jgi:hypothetical protein